MFVKITTHNNSNYVRKIILLIVMLVYVLLCVDARKHNSYRRLYKKNSSTSTTNIHATTPRTNFYGAQNTYTTSYPYPYGNYYQRPTWDNTDYKTNRKIKMKNKIETERHSPYGHELKAVEKDDTLDGLTGVVGPLIFPIPFLLSILPFAIPAIPIALLLPFGNSNSTTDEEG